MKTIRTYLTSLPIGVKWIVGLNLGIYIITLLVRLITDESLQNYLGVYPTFSENFNILSVFTSMFMHSFDPTHVITNMVLMLIFAPFVEKVLGSKQFVISYFVIGLIGFLFVNYSYIENKIRVDRTINSVGLDVKNIKVENGKVSKDYLNSLTKEQSEVVVNYNKVISKTYGASACLFGVIVLFILFNLSSFKKTTFVILGFCLILNSFYRNLNSGQLLSGGEFAHLGGMIGGVLTFIQYKQKKGIN